MTLLDLSQLRPVLETATQDLFRWETLPAYEVASDGSDYRRYLDGAHAPTTARKQPWLDTLRAWAEQGRPRRRVRIIHDPITDYERYACEWGYALNAQVGEIIRVIDLAHTSLPPELTRIGGDFWLVDDREVVAMYYQPDGQLPLTMHARHAFHLYDSHTVIVGTESGTAFITDPVEVKAYDRRFAELEHVAVFGDEAAQVFERVADDYRYLT